MKVQDLPTYGIAEGEKLLGLTRHRLYALIKEGRVEAVRDVTGQLKITYEELFHLRHERAGNTQER